MSERLPSREFDRLAESIWHLGQVSMRHLFEIAPVPATLIKPIYHGDLCLEPEFLLHKPFMELLKTDELPQKVGITISEAAPYSVDDRFTIYTARTVTLNTVRRTREFSRGLVLMDGTGTITPELLPNERRRRGTMEWRDLQTRADYFGKRDAQMFIDTIDQATDKLYQDNLGI